MFKDDEEEEYNPSQAAAVKHEEDSYNYKPSYQQTPEEDTYKTAYESTPQVYQSEPPKQNKLRFDDEEENTYNPSSTHT